MIPGFILTGINLSLKFSVSNLVNSSDDSKGRRKLQTTDLDTSYNGRFVASYRKIREWLITEGKISKVACEYK